MYNEMVEELGDKIASKNDETKTIEMTQENIDSVTRLDLSRVVESDLEITSIEGIEKFTNLTYLDLHVNNIENISVLEGLTNLTELDLWDNKIEDISALEGLTNLTDLDLRYNEIKDISALEGLTNLTDLNLENNNVEDISVLEGLTNLTYLDLSNNNVEDISKLESLKNLKDINLKYQLIHRVTQQTTIELPPIFLQAQDPESIGYADGELLFENCYLDEDGVTVHINEGVTNAYVEIEGVNGLDGSRLEITTSTDDLVPPELTVEYSNQNPTKEDVIVTITANEQIQPVEEWTLSEDQTTLTKTFKENKTEKFKVKDLAGNETEVEIKVENIDKQAPTLNVEYSNPNPTKENVTVTITADEEIQEVEGWELSQDKKVLTKTYTENTNETIEIYDMLGNKTTQEITVNNIDKQAPEAQITYSTKEMASNVIATITANEPIQEVEGWNIDATGKILTKTYTQNIKEEVIIKDLAGNETTVTIEISNIDPSLDNEVLIEKVEYSNQEPTNEDVTVTIIANEKLQEIEGWELSENGQELRKKYSENTTETVIVKDELGNEKEIEIIINNIDKQAPEETIEYSTKNPTKSNVQVTITANETVKEIEGWSLDATGKILTKTYSQNTSETITLEDLAKNTKQVQIEISNIDKEAPKVEITYNKTQEGVEVKITANEEIQEVEGWKISEDKKELTKTYKQNKEEEFMVKDLAGNESKVTIKVDSIVEGLPGEGNNANNNENTNNNNDNKTPPTKLPNAGKITITLMVIIGLALCVIFYIKYRKYKELSNLK